jgi:glutamine synthetase
MVRRRQGLGRALAIVKKTGAERVNLRFVDLLGRWHQVTLPASNFGSQTFSKGVAFDGSSIPGFTRLESGDLRLIPDPDTGFVEDLGGGRAVNVVCNCVEADTMKPFARDPRLVVAKAERFLVKTGIADHAFFMPELEFNLLEEVKLVGSPEATGYLVRSREGGREPQDGSRVYPWIRDKSGYHALPPADCYAHLRALMVKAMEKAGIPVKYTHHEVGSAGQCEIEVRPSRPVETADNIMIGTHIIKNLAAAHGCLATFIPKILFGQPGNGMHFHQHLVKGGRNIFYRRGGYGNLSDIALSYIGGILKHGPALLALTCASTNSYRRLVPGFEAPTCFVFAIGNRSAAVRIPKGISSARDARIEFRPSDASGNSYLSVAAMLMAGLDGIRHNVDPAKEGFGPFDLDVFKLSDLKTQGITPVPFRLEDALEALKADNGFLLEGGVFTADLVETWVELKLAEVNAVGRRPHPYEVELYLDC